MPRQVEVPIKITLDDVPKEVFERIKDLEDENKKLKAKLDRRDHKIKGLEANAEHVLEAQAVIHDAAHSLLEIYPEIADGYQYA